MITKYIKKYLFAGLVGCALSTVFSSCSDEPSNEYFYTFNGEMMSDYLYNRSQYSGFTKIVERAELMNLLASYGHYTCFLPSNEAIDTYLKEKGLNTVDELSKEDCDTIARTHLVDNMYSTLSMLPTSGNMEGSTYSLPTPNMMGRYLSIGSEEIDGHAVIKVNGTAHIYYELQNDSVENGIVQPINQVLQQSNDFAADLLNQNDAIGIFFEALKRTGVYNDIQLVEDENYLYSTNAEGVKTEKSYPKYYYKSHTWQEVAWAPSSRKIGYTIFVEPDDVYLAKFKELGISTANGNLRALYDLAASIYGEVYPKDVNADGWKFENLTDSINPLRRFVQYHILNRLVAEVDKLTAPVMNVGSVHEAFGFDTKLVNPCDWYTTLLPHTMVKVDQLTVQQDEAGNDCVGIDGGKMGERFLNRRYDGSYKHRGAWIDSRIDANNEHKGVNGSYFYIDDILAFSKEVRDEVQNQRIRMDFSAIFPEVMTNNMRQVGTPTADDSNVTPDDSSSPVNGKNYYFPEGYLDGVTFSNCYCVLRRPHINFWSWQGDEWNLFGDYDFTFRIPPVPYTGEWQLRLGFCALETRGVMQVYFDGIPQGIPLDMTKYLNSELYIGDRFDGKGADGGDESLSDYKKMSTEEKAEQQKLLRNLGAYRDGRSQYHFNTSGTKYFFAGNPRTYRRILCQTTIDANTDHYIRFRVASDGKQGNNNEFMLDFFEMVPKSVYAVDGDGEMEDDL